MGGYGYKLQLMIIQVVTPPVNYFFMINNNRKKFLHKINEVVTQTTQNNIP